MRSRILRGKDVLQWELSGVHAGESCKVNSEQAKAKNMAQFDQTDKIAASKAQQRVLAGQNIKRTHTVRMLLDQSAEPCGRCASSGWVKFDFHRHARQ